MKKMGKKEWLEAIYDYIVDTDTDNNYEEYRDFLKKEIEAVIKKNRHSSHHKATTPLTTEV